MNKSYVSKWNSALGAWVACSEISRRAGKISGAVLLVLAGQSYAQTCTQYPNKSYIPGDNNSVAYPFCTTVPATSGQLVMGPDAAWYVLTRSRLSGASSLATVGDANVQAYVNADFGGITNQYAYSPAAIQTGNATFDVKANGNVTSLQSHSGVSITGKNLDTTVVDNYTSGNTSGNVHMYGILAGSSVNSGEGGTDASRNGTFTTVTVDNAKIVQTSVGGTKQPILNNGLRAIQGAYRDAGNGSSGKIVINNDLDMSLSGRRMEGIYVSGAASSAAGTEAVSQVILNGKSTIGLTNSGGASVDSSAIKVGKSRAVGTGKGLVVSNGNLTINMDPSVTGTQPYHGAAIKMAVSGSQLLANQAASSNTIKANKTALAIGIDDWGSSADSTGISAAFGKATVTTQSSTAPLLLVDSGQQDVQILFDQQSKLTAASDGYLIDIIKYRTSTAASSVELTLDNASTMQGLTNKAYATSTSNVNLSNGSIWNMAVKATDAVATATLDTLKMTTGSVLNAFNQLDVAQTSETRFIMVGQVSSDASTVNLQDPTPTADDQLTINGNYSGANNAVLAIDTCLGADNAPSDTMTVNGAVSGTTIIRVKPTIGASCVGAATTTGIPVVKVTGTSPANAFVLEGGTVKQGNYIYKLVQDGNDWFLRATPLPTANLACNPATLVDSPNNQSICKLTLDGPAPAGGLTVTITPPAGSTRYETTCGTSLRVDELQTEATCTITAIANTTPGDGSVDAVVTINPADGYQVGPNASATVTINNDDVVPAVTPIPTLNQWALMLLSLGLMGGVWRQRRR